MEPARNPERQRIGNRVARPVENPRARACSMIEHVAKGRHHFGCQRRTRLPAISGLKMEGVADALCHAGQLALQSLGS